MMICHLLILIHKELMTLYQDTNHFLIFISHKHLIEVVFSKSNWVMI